MKQLNKLGFTLTELLAAIAILAILGAFVVPAVMNYLKSSKLQAMEVQEGKVVEAAQIYLEDYCFNPISSSSVCNYTNNLVLLCDVQEAEFIDEVQSSGEICEGIVYYKENNDGTISKKAYLSCGDAYKTECTDTDTGTDIVGFCNNIDTIFDNNSCEL